MLCSVHGQNPSTDTTERERGRERECERERERERESDSREIFLCQWQLQAVLGWGGPEMRSVGQVPKAAQRLG